MPGCGLRRRGSDTARTVSNDLKQLGLAYHGFNDKYRRGPANAEELKEFVEPGDPVYQKLAAGTYIFQYGMALRDMFELGTSETILAYEKDVPTKGGMVLMGDSSVQQMSAEEFKNWPRPKAAKN